MKQLITTVELAFHPTFILNEYEIVLRRVIVGISVFNKKNYVYNIEH